MLCLRRFALPIVLRIQREIYYRTAKENHINPT